MNLSRENYNQVDEVMALIYRGHQILLVHLPPSNKMVVTKFGWCNCLPIKLHVDHLIVLDFWFRLD